MTANPDDPRPRVAIGHIGPHLVPDLAAGTRFYVALGCRLIAELETLSVLELRGGTHLVLREGEAAGGKAGFDIMVDDVDATREQYAELGFAPTPIERGTIHDHFTLQDPAGSTLTITSSHAQGPV